MARYDTAGNIVIQAALELGLGRLTDPFGSSDDLPLQLCAFFNAQGQDLLKHKWGNLKTQYTWVADGSATKALPSDYHALIADTVWDRTGQNKLEGPNDSSAWQTIKAWSPVGALTIYFRVDQNQLEFEPAPASGINLVLEYLSRSWITAGSSVPPGYAYTTLGSGGKEAAETSSDVCLINSRLMIAAVKLAWKAEKGFDTARTQQDFEDALEAAINVVPQPVRYLAGARRGLKLIDETNLPQTGIGS